MGVIAGVVAASAASAAVWSGTGNADANHVTKAPTVMTRKAGKLGVILVNGQGRTLYMFVRDHQTTVTCRGSCAAIWPPLKIKPTQVPTAGGAAKKSLLGTDSGSAFRGVVVTYNRWPLYTYIKDKKPGQVRGEGVRNSGGRWYVLSPSGKVIKR